MSPEYSFHGQTVLITGASGGIGQAVAREFSQAGAAVLLHANKNAEIVQKLLNELQNRGGRGEVILGDFSRSDAAETFLHQIDGTADKIDILVNAAGTDLMSPETAALPFEQRMRTLFQTDVFTVLQLSRTLGNRMKAAGNGTVFFFGWNGVHYGWQSETAELYGAAKGAVAGFSRSFAECLAPEVRVRVLHLGWIATRWGTNSSEEFQCRGKRDSLMNRWGTAQDVAHTVLFLASDAAAFVDGTAVFVDGTKRGTRQTL